MSSEDTMKYAESEKASAEAMKNEVAKQQAKIDALQKDVGTNPDLQDDLDSEMDILVSLQDRQRRHEEDWRRLNGEALDEQRKEQEELLKNAKNDDNLAERALKEGFKRGIL